MKTEDLKALGLNDEQVQRVFAMNGADVNREKQAAETAKAERDALRTQLTEANEKLKGYDPDWQQKTADLKAQLSEQKDSYEFGAALDEAIRATPCHSAAAVKKMLDLDTLRKSDDRKKAISDALTALQASDAYLFAGTAARPKGKTPTIVTQTTPGSSDINKEQFAKMGYAARLALKRSNPERYAALTGTAVPKNDNKKE